MRDPVNQIGILKINNIYLLNFLIFLFFSFIAISLLSPIASNKYLPLAPDFANHVALLIQAKMAMLEGQFPIRTAPWQFNGWHYPVFQFYSPLPYMLGVGVYAFLTPSNPYVAYKIITWLSLTLGGIYIYRTARMLVGSRIPGILAGVAYMMAPYFIINVDVRGAFTEAAAQGIVPIALYYTLFMYFNGASVKNFCFTSLSWFALVTTHLISFIYSSLFIGVFLVLLSFQSRHCWKKLMYTGIAYGYSWLLALWFILPIIKEEGNLNIHESLSNPTDANWLTPLAELFSIQSVSPIPLPGNSQLPLPLYPSIGWCMLLAAAICVLAVISLSRSSLMLRIIKPLLSLFLLAILVTWSPTDFWKYLPKFLSITQFSYRLLTQVMWTGSLLLAFAIVLMCKEKLNICGAMIGVLLIGLSSSSWLHTNKSSPTSIDNLKLSPDMGYGQGAYLLNSMKPIVHGGIRLPLVSVDGWLDSSESIRISRKLINNNPKIQLHLEGTMPSEYLKPPITLRAELNGITIYKKQILEPGFIIDIPLKVKLDSTKNSFIEFRLLTDRYFIPHEINPAFADTRKLSMRLKSAKITNVSVAENVLPVEQVQSNCKQVKTATICSFITPSDISLVQLPILYYPGMLDIKADGQSISYSPLQQGKALILTGVKLAPGKHNLQLSFIGIKWANYLSLVGWLTLFMLLTSSLLCKKNKNHTNLDLTPSHDIFYRDL